MASNYYEVLGVGRNASEKDIRQAYRRLARKHHPDVNRGAPDAEARFKEINEAYQVLSNAENRKKYDAFGDGWRRVGSYETGSEDDPPSWMFRSGRGGRRSGGRSGFGSLFDDLFGSQRAGRVSTGDRLGDLSGSRQVGVRVTVSLEEAYRGATRLVHVPADPMLGVSGQRLEVKVPPGVDTGSRVHIAPNAGSGRPDIYLVISVTPHQRFDRTGDDLSVSVSAPLVDAVLGTEVEVSTIKGSRVVLKLPPETQNGRTFRLRGQGMPRLDTPSHYGDLLVTVQVRLPADLSDEERGLFQRLRELRPNDI